MNRYAWVVSGVMLAGANAPATQGAMGQEQEKGPAIFIELEEVTAPIVDASHIQGTLRVTITLQTHEMEKAALLNTHKPELRMAALAGTMEYARLYASPFMPVDVRKLVSILSPALHRAVPGIDRVLIIKVSAMAG